MTFVEQHERHTAQRDLVFQIVADRCDHPTAQDVHEQARANMPAISLGTVYRNLQRLVDQGLLLESKNGRKPARYEARRHRHYHIHCTQCGSLEDVSVPYQEALDRKVEKQLHYKLDEHRLEFFGLCPKCQKGRRKSVAGMGSLRHTTSVRN
jgi:Fur family peroxide stress response transcriptional regulator